jgi:trans-aconitate methyltransferase
MKWNTDLYDKSHSFVSEYGKSLISHVNCNSGQVILDLGCGTGTLAYELSKKGATVIGIDPSAEMVDKAKNSYPDLTFLVEDATKLPYESSFDTVFSNAVFHWITDQEKLLQCVHNALKPNGALICEFGAHGNIHSIQSAFSKITKTYGYDFQNPFYFPTSDEYAKLLSHAGFKIEHIMDYDRPTPLAGGANGVRNWVIQFFEKDLKFFTQDQQETILNDLDKELKPILWRGDIWIADYRRIQVIAYKNNADAKL